MELDRPAWASGDVLPQAIAITQQEQRIAYNEQAIAVMNANGVKATLANLQFEAEKFKAEGQSVPVWLTTMIIDAQAQVRAYEQAEADAVAAAKAAKSREDDLIKNGIDGEK